MGTVHYKFTYNEEIDFPETIKFCGKEADLEKDSQEGYIIEGDVENVYLYADGRMHIYISSSGRTGRTWELEVAYDDKKLKTFPIEGTIKDNGFFTLNKKYKLP